MRQKTGEAPGRDQYAATQEAALQRLPVHATATFLLMVGQQSLDQTAASSVPPRQTSATRACSFVYRTREAAAQGG
ncbi:MAG: hypothetical protein HYZ28_08105 [Myxococcales bacterium]|nr:hypothetical protein [Myxococcales bacterium]